MAHEFAPSVAARKAWESQHPVGEPAVARQQTLWEEPASAERKAAAAALDELQGRPQTFWEKNGAGDEFPAPVTVVASPEVVVAGPPFAEPASGLGAENAPPAEEQVLFDPASGPEAAVHMLNYVIGYLYEAVDGIKKKDFVSASGMMRDSVATLQALPSLLGDDL